MKKLCRKCGNGQVYAEHYEAYQLALCQDCYDEYHSNGIKNDQEKPRCDLIPPLAIMEISRVLEFGARKYSPDNWRKVPNLKARYTAAMLRHVFAWMSGEKIDTESGLHHLAHAGCCLLFLLEIVIPEWAKLYGIERGEE